MPSKPVLQWAPCDTFECAVLTTPLDYDNPKRGSVDAGVIRRKATTITKRIGTIVFNPGGPGLSAVGALQDIDALLSAEVLDRFDVMAIEPRGVGATELPCDFSAITTSLANDTTQDLYQSYRSVCAKQAGPLALHVDTVASARDIEQARLALGEDKISIVGFSWGGYLGATYALLFPNHVRAFVADSPEDLVTVGSVRAQERVDAWETTVQGFSTACKSLPVTTCPLNDGTDPLDRIIQIDDALAKIPDGDSGATLRLRFERSLLDALQVGAGPILAAALAGLARTPDAGTLQLFERAVAQFRAALTTFSPPALSAASVPTALFAVGCDDAKLPSAPIVLNAPHFQEYATLLGDVLACSGWPPGAGSKRPAVMPLPRMGGPTTMVIGTTFDSDTPLSWAQRLTDQLGGRLLTRNGLGHVSSGRKLPCIDNAVTAYLLDLTLPPIDAAC